MEDYKGKKKTRGLFNILFSRTTVIILLLVLQILVLAAFFYFMRRNGYWVYGISIFLSFVAVVYIVNCNDKPEFKLAWIIPIIVFPVFGGLFYLYVKMEGSRKHLRMNLERTHFDVSPYMAQNPDVERELRRSSPADANLCHYLYHQLGYPVHRNTEVKYFPLGEDWFEELMDQLDKAKDFIFMEYFIVSEGYMWDTILDMLKRKAKQGVEIRFLYDGMNVISQLPYNYPKTLKSYGINAKMFSPLKPVLSTYHNNRDHRKICVIDGIVGFTGGANLADEYINREERFGHWKDTAVMLTGDAVQNLTMMFLEMWNVNEKRDEDYRRYLTPVSSTVMKSCGYVIPYGDNPFNSENVGERVYFHILEHAKKYVHIMTPYLILDNEMISHLTYAAKSGIEVFIIMPHIPDKWYAFALAKTYYEELINAGVRIFEYTPGFVHAKVFVSDDESAVVGTINCDYRSLFLHFECASYIFRNQAVFDIEDDFMNTLKKCQRLSIVDCKKQSTFTKVSGRILRLLAPLM